MILLSVSIIWVGSFSIARYQVLEIKNEIDSYQPNAETSISIRISDDKLLNYLHYIDYITVAWFSFDLIIRFIVAPNKSVFLGKFDNYVDIIATCWFYFDTILSQFITVKIIQFLEVLRVLRLIKLFSYNPGLKVIITSLKASAHVLKLLLFVMVIASTLFGSFVFYAEKLTNSDQDLNKIPSVIEGLWYAVVSLTTIGYGDLTPITLLGRIFGGLCVITGVLMIGLPMTIVVEIFTDFYNHLRARSKLPKQRRRILPVEAPRIRKKNANQGPGAGNASNTALGVD
jgi:potassium voltage-gated channel Shaw-related subfamily C protein 1